MSKICSVGQQAGGPGEPMVQKAVCWRIPSCFFVLFMPIFFVLFRPSTDWMRLIHIMEGNLFYPEFTDLNVNLIQKHPPGFPGGAVVESLPANAGDTGSGPGPGRSHMPRSGWACAPQLLSVRSGARVPQLLKPTRLEPVLRSEGGHRGGRPARRGEEWPSLASAGGSLRAAAGAQCSQK